MNKEEMREYISCPQFGDEHYGKWGALNIEQRLCIKHLLDENKQYQSDIKKLMCENENLERHNKQLKERIDTAIEYIEYIGMDDTFDKVLLEILKGDSNED